MNETLMHEWHKGKGKAYITAGTGQGKTPLAAFDFAELDANITATNAIPVTSFIPPTWEVRMAGEELREKTNKGRFIPMAFEYETSKLETVSSAVAVGIPEDDHAGIFMEYSEKGMGAKELEERAIKSVREVFSFRNWRAKEIISKSVEERPKRNTYACSLVSILFFPEISEK